MACNFSIPFSGQPQILLNKAKSTIVSQGGTFTGDDSEGSFFVSVIGNTVKGTYTVEGQSLNVIISEKPFLIPCSTIENFLKKQLT